MFPLTFFFNSIFKFYNPCLFQGYHDGQPPSDNYARLERMVARVVNPHLGFFGLYEGSPIPAIPCSIKPASTPKLKGLFIWSIINSSLHQLCNISLIHLMTEPCHANYVLEVFLIKIFIFQFSDYT